MGRQCAGNSHCSAHPAAPRFPPPSCLPAGTLLLPFLSQPRLLLSAFSPSSAKTSEPGDKECSFQNAIPLEEPRVRGARNCSPPRLEECPKSARNKLYLYSLVYKLLDWCVITTSLWREDAEHPLCLDIAIELLPVFQAGWVVIPHIALKLKETKIYLQGSVQSCNDLKPERVKRAVIYVFSLVSWMSGDT